MLCKEHVAALSSEKEHLHGEHSLETMPYFVQDQPAWQSAVAIPEFEGEVAQVFKLKLKLGDPAQGWDFNEFFFQKSVHSISIILSSGTTSNKGCKGLPWLMSCTQTGWSAAGKRPQGHTAKGRGGSLWDGAILNLEKDWHSLCSSSSWWLKWERLCCQHLNRVS